MDRPREPLPTRVEDTPTLPPPTTTPSTRASPRSALALTAAARAAIDGHVRLLLAWTAAINLTAIREPAAVAVGHVLDSLTAVALLRERGVDRFIDLGSGGGYPGLPLAAALPSARALLLEPIGQEGRASCRPSSPRPAWTDTVEAAPVRAEALAADPRHRGRWPAVTARAVAPLADLVELAVPAARPGRLPRRLEARRPRPTSWPPRTGRIAALGGGHARGPAGRRRRGSTATGWSSSPRAAGARPPTRAIPAHAQATAVVSGALLRFGPRAHRRPVGHPQQPRRPRRRARPDRIGRRRLAPRRRRRLRPRAGCASSSGCARSGAIGVRGNHDAAASRRRPRSTGSTPRRGRRWSGPATAISRADPRLAGGAAPAPRSRPTSRSSTAARATRPGSTSPRRRSPAPACRRSRPSTACTATPTSRSRSRWSTAGCARSPRGRQHRRPRRGPDAAQPGQRRPAARRRPAGELPDPRHRRRGPRPGAASPTTSRPVGAMIRAGRAAGAPGRSAARRRLTADDRRTAPAAGPQAGRSARPRRAAARAVLPLHRQGPADRQGGGQRPDDRRRARRSPRSAASSSAARWRARRSSASACRRRRRWPSSARTPSARRPTRPRRSCAS